MLSSRLSPSTVSQGSSAATESDSEATIPQLLVLDNETTAENGSEYMGDSEAQGDDSDASGRSNWTISEKDGEPEEEFYTLRHAQIPPITQQADTQEGGSYYTADHIEDEKRGRVLVIWSGIDTKTGLPFEPSWVRRKDCTEALLRDWDERKGTAKVRLPGRHTDSQASYHDSLPEPSSAKYILSPSLLSKRERPLRASSASLRSASSSSGQTGDIFDFPSDDDSPSESGRVRKKQKLSTNSPTIESSLSSLASGRIDLQASLEPASARATSRAKELSPAPASASRSRGVSKGQGSQNKSVSVTRGTGRLSRAFEELVSPGRNQTAFGESIVGIFECVRLPPVPLNPHLPIITKESIRYRQSQIGRRFNLVTPLFYPSSSSESESESELEWHSPAPYLHDQPIEQLSPPVNRSDAFHPGTKPASLEHHSPSALELTSAPVSSQIEIISNTASEKVTGQSKTAPFVIDLSDDDSEPPRESQSQASALKAQSEIDAAIDQRSLPRSKDLVFYKTVISDSDPQISDVSVGTLLKPIGEDSPSTKDSESSQSSLGPRLGEIEVPATISQDHPPSSEPNRAELDTYPFVEDSQSGKQQDKNQQVSVSDSAPVGQPVHYSEQALNSPVRDSQPNEFAPEDGSSNAPFTLVEEETIHRVEGWLSTQVQANFEVNNISDFDSESFPQPPHLDTQMLNVNSNVSLNTKENSAPAMEGLQQGSSQAMQDIQPAEVASPEPQKTMPPTASPHSASKAMTEGLASGVARLPDNNVTDGSITLDKYRLGPAEYAVPVGLRDFQRQMYEQVLILHSSEILRFCDFGSSSKAFRDRLAQDMLKVLNRTLLAATHPYLLVPTLLPRNLSDKDESRYIVHSGEKFRILDNIITVFKEAGLKLGIVAREGHTMDIVSDFLGGKRIKYARRDGVIESDVETDEEDVNSENEAFAKVTVIVVPSTARDRNTKKKKFALPKVDLVVALDASFIGSEPQVRQLRGVANEGDIPTVPVLRLVSVNTSEHALLGAAATLGLHDSVVDTAVLSSIITAITLLRARAGTLPESVVKEIDAMPAKLPEWLARGCTTMFPVSLIAPPSGNSFAVDIPSTMFSVREFTPAEADEALSSLTEGSMVSELLNVLEAENQKSLNLAIEAAIRHILKYTRESDGIGGGSAGLHTQESLVKESIAPSLLEKNGSIYPEQRFASDHLQTDDVVMHDNDNAYDSELELDALSIDEKEEMIKVKTQ
ncbi:class II histone deacetylase complex subunits 2 and 3-domain-containing protein [Lipomyces tetrasporus]|uniref:Class II histone deacetylase complex subunits 2 and 3-domain-containing protein n=1 Tax=Lipomyces tetrasporus TaxID=54092 RepID=A0AAD7VWU0_9ASCO|nr:class II histone deacetylase complex subunits 2 and 3-domain-containing protein [Lipomyces tetrasporus]KAJ8103975.1 class II histone deacetylase complex subunits 2 and 3-domain-containing protein [Lipomyces tetrasporus]